MNKIFVVLAILTVAACGSKKSDKSGDDKGSGSSAAPASIGDEAIAKMKGFADKTCACKDKACADAVSKEMATWGEEGAAKYKDYKPSEAEMKSMSAESARLSECVAKLVTADVPPPPPAGSGDTVAPPAGDTAAPPAAAGGSASEGIAKMKELTDKMCACKDKACGDGVTKEMSDWQTANADKFKDVKPTEAEMTELTTVSQKLGECMAKLQAP